MGRLAKRLKDLESSTEVRATESEDAERSRRDLQLWYRTCENSQREQEGLPPIPLSLEELRWSREADEEGAEELEKYFDTLVRFEEQRAKNAEGRRWG